PTFFQVPAASLGLSLFGEKATASTEPPRFSSFSRSCPVSASQIRTLPSRLPEASNRSSGEKATAHTQSSWPRKTSTFGPPSQTLTLRSKLPETIVFPLADNASDRTQPRCPGKAPSCLALAGSQKRSRLSLPPVTSALSSMKERAKIPREC